jgi:hypothetical protein
MMTFCSAEFAATIHQNPEALPELLERAADEVDSALTAIDRFPSARWALTSCGLFLESMTRGIAFAAEQGSKIAAVYIRCWKQSATVPDLRDAARGLRRFNGPTPTARRFPDEARDFADFLREWLAVQQRLQSPPTPHLELQEQQPQPAAPPSPHVVECSDPSEVSAEQLAEFGDINEKTIRTQLGHCEARTDRSNHRRYWRYADVLPVLREWCRKHREQRFKDIRWPERAADLQKRKTTRPESRKK